MIPEFLCMTVSRPTREATLTETSARLAPMLCVLWPSTIGATDVEQVLVSPDPSVALTLLFDALPAVVFGVLVARCRKGLLAAQVQWRHRLLLALLAGWLSAVLYRLTGDWLFGFPSYAAIIAIGALFGLFVLAPLLPGAARHPIRVALLAATAALGHYAAWLTAASLFDLINESLNEWGDVIVALGGLGGPALVLFALQTAVAAWRVAALRPTGKFWWALLGSSWASGWLYQSAALDAWRASLVLPGQTSDYVIYPVLMLWYGLSSLAFGLAPRQALKKPGAADIALLAGLLLGWAWMLLSSRGGSF